MSNRLLIDEGNTFTKLELWRDGVKDFGLVCKHNEVPAQLAARAVALPVDEAIICSVRGENRTTTEFGRRTIVLDCNTPSPLKINYSATLGSDRIAAAAGALSLAQGKKCLVIDLGTAITYDLLSADGCFCGGNIAPGIYMRAHALHQFTKALPEVELEGDTPLWGHDTHSAIRSGAILGAVGEIERYIRQAADDGSDIVVILTGGQAKLAIPYIKTNYPIIHEPNLVLMGLKCIINYNEIK